MPVDEEPDGRKLWLVVGVGGSFMVIVVDDDDDDADVERRNGLCQNKNEIF